MRTTTYLDDYETEVLTAFEFGQLKSVGDEDEIARFKAAAHVTLEERRSSRDGDDFLANTNRSIGGR